MNSVYIYICIKRERGLRTENAKEQLLEDLSLLISGMLRSSHSRLSADESAAMVTVRAKRSDA